MFTNVSCSPPPVMTMEREMAQLCQPSRLCTSMRLREFPDQFVFEPLNGGRFQPLSVNRITGDPCFLEEIPVDQNVPTSTVYGIMGLIRLLAGSYVLVITSREEIGCYCGASIFRVSSMKVLECNMDLQHLTDSQKKDEAHFLSILKSVETTPGLYFSFETDLTLSSQLSHATSKQTHSLWKMADPRFLWNGHLLEELIENKLEPYILPVIQGSYQTMQISIGEKHASLTLLSRRCIRRIGTRMWRRGANFEGYAANFVETEQVLEIEGYRASYVQIRGSIPVLWEQIVDLTYKPKIEALCLDETVPKVVERHFRDISKRYGSVIAVDLINQQGNEGVLSQAYANAMQKLVTDKLRYVQFDFHRICGHIHFERLSSLYDQIKEDITQQGFFLASSDGVTQVQHGVVRTNCVDCLDRTNVTQSLLGRKTLETQLRQLGIFLLGDTIDQNPDFDDKFKFMWANHGDEISMQYSGTPALKGDFVRYGKRTVFGLIRDGFHALTRYFLNNFTDGIKQDAMDLIAGHYTVARNKPSPFKLNGFEALAYLPFASVMMVTGLTMTTFSLRQVGQDISQFLYSVVWAGLTAGTMAIVKANGRQFCNRPRLCGLR